jgi:hypothetical protein
MPERSKHLCEQTPMQTNLACWTALSWCTCRFSKLYNILSMKVRSSQGLEVKLLCPRFW